MARGKVRKFDTGLKETARSLPATGYPITKLGIKLFGATAMDVWRKRLIEHYRNDPVAYDRFERWLRKKHKLTAEKGGAILLDWAIEETLRAILSTRKGKARDSSISERRVMYYTYSKADLVLEAPAKAVTSFKGEAIKHEVDGIIGIDCTVREPGGVFFKKVRCRFVSHPFWQLGVSVMPQGGDDGDDDTDLDADDENEDDGESDDDDGN